MLFKRKNFAVKTESLLTEDAGKMIRLLPCIDVWWNDAVCISFSWLFGSVSFWFGDAKDLL